MLGLATGFRCSILVWNLSSYKIVFAERLGSKSSNINLLLYESQNDSWSKNRGVQFTPLFLLVRKSYFYSFSGVEFTPSGVKVKMHA